MNNDHYFEVGQTNKKLKQTFEIDINYMESKCKQY